MQGENKQVSVNLKGAPSVKKIMFSLGHCPNYLSPPPPLLSGNLYIFFLDVKNDVLTRITEPSINNDYDNDGSDNCNYNFVTFGDFGVKNDQKVSHIT